MVLMGASLPTSGSLETASRIGILTAVLVAVSSTVHLMKVRERSRRREASEGKRLYAAIQYPTEGNPSVTGGEPSEADDSTHPGDAGGQTGDAGGHPGDAGAELG